MEEKKEKLAQKEEKIGQALLKVALGYQIAEVTEEYAEVDGELKLTKRKKTKRSPCRSARPFPPPSSGP